MGIRRAVASSTVAHYQNDPQEFQYGLGTGSIPVFGVDNWGHGGSIIYRSLAYYFPDQNMSFAFQQNDRIQLGIHLSNSIEENLRDLL